MSSESRCLFIKINGDQCKRKQIEGTDFCRNCSKSKPLMQKKISKIFWEINKGDNIEYPVVKYNIATTIAQMKFEKEMLDAKTVEMETQKALYNLNMERIKMELEKIQIGLENIKKMENNLMENLNATLERYVGFPIETENPQSNDSINPADFPDTAVADQKNQKNPADLYSPQPGHYYVDCTTNTSNCKLEVVEDLLANLHYNKCIIFISTPESGCSVSNKLRQSQRLGQIHLNTCWKFMDGVQKEVIWKSFLSKENSVLITSDWKFGKTFDLSGINLIINYNVAINLSTYMSRAEYLKSEGNKKKIIITLIDKNSIEWSPEVIRMKKFILQELPDHLDELL